MWKPSSESENSLQHSEWKLSPSNARNVYPDHSTGFYSVKINTSLPVFSDQRRTAPGDDNDCCLFVTLDTLEGDW